MYRNFIEPGGYYFILIRENDSFTSRLNNELNVAAFIW